MAFTVSCTACGSRFLLGDDLFRRKVSGNIVTVKCRTCEAEISVDARDVDTLPSHAPPPRKAPAPPRPKDKMGLVPAKPMSLEEATAAWESEQTRAISHRPAAQSQETQSQETQSQEAQSQEPELVEFEEVPASSSDSPALNALRHEPARVHPPRKKAPDEFLVNLTTGSGGLLGPPTIDVSGLTSAPTIDVSGLTAATTATTPRAPVALDEPEIEAELVTQPTGIAPISPTRAVAAPPPAAPFGKATMPLFDMSAVLPSANTSATTSSASSAPMQIDIDVGSASNSERASYRKSRQRRNVVAPDDAPPEHKSKRGGVGVWFAVAVAAVVLLVVGLRGHRAPQAASTEPALDHSAAVLSNAAPAIQAAPPVADISSAAAAAPAAPPAAARPSIARATSTAPAAALNTTSATATTTTNVASANVKSAAPEKLAQLEPAAAGPALAATEDPARPVAPAGTALVDERPPAAAPGTEFDRSAAVNALKSSAAQASSCRKDGDPSGTASLTITFAPSGRVTSAQVQGPPFAGTATGGCIANAMRRTQIPAFDGDRVTVTKTVVIE